ADWSARSRLRAQMRSNPMYRVANNGAALRDVGVQGAARADSAEDVALWMRAPSQINLSEILHP
ncbi:MAG: hypothetical protein O6758_06465, partial [Planctomycetota bacterium]|nr:hypothetical protein [Planctomycetota bacterium]